MAVKAAHGLVEDEQIRPLGERQQEHNLRLLPAGQLADGAVQ